MTAVYINWGRFIVECSCGDAREVKPGQATETCVNHHVIKVEWPRGIEQISTALTDRPEDRHRNWFPEDHPVALATGQPHGQTVADLKVEARHHEAETADKRQQVADAMAALGLTFDPATGLVKGL